ncbi:MAG: hypothetical protein INR62_08675, partial [Rhodospirillales bacterium]|nr:hypothetical protein [Acetobacter sp.]
EQPICHVHHIDLISDPVSTVENVYRHFSLPFDPRMAAAIEGYVAARPRGGYGAHSYRFEDHGLHEKQERERFRPYMVHFGVSAETTGRSDKPITPAFRAGAIS